MMSPSPESSIDPQSHGPAEELGGGRYVVVGSLGAGSQGETLEAVDKREGRVVAVKRFTIRGAKSWKNVELAEREATVLSSLSHPSLPRYIEHFEEDGALYLVMEKIEGETLASRRRHGRGLDQQQVLRFLKEAGTCLSYLHGQAPPVVHRDIKPGNVILRPDGSYCLVDFGSVRDRLKPEGGSTVVGTFGFMAPEQFQGRAAPGSDVYAVAATALSLLTGSEPEDLPHKGLGIDVESALRGQVDRRVIVALRSMLEPDPDRRVTSVETALRQAGLWHAEPERAESSAQAAKKARKARLEAEGWLGNDRGDSRNSRQSGKAARRERKAERKADRRARRSAQGHWHRPGRAIPPAVLLGIFLQLGLRVAMVATFALFRILLPLLFTLLAVLAGPRMYERRHRMIELGKAGQQGLERATEHIRYQLMAGPEPAVTSFSEPSPPPRQRVSADAIEAEIEAAIESELEARFDPERRRRR
jgi:hypothetical protein